MKPPRSLAAIVLTAALNATCTCGEVEAPLPPPPPPIVDAGSDSDTDSDVLSSEPQHYVPYYDMLGLADKLPHGRGCPPLIACIGDSHTAGPHNWPNKLRDVCPDSIILNQDDNPRTGFQSRKGTEPFAAYGRTSGEMLEKLPQVINYVRRQGSLEDCVFVLLIGTNDIISNGEDITPIYSNIVKMIDIIHNDGAKVISVVPPPFMNAELRAKRIRNVDPELIPRNMRKLRDAMLHDDHPADAVVDLYSVFALPASYEEESVVDGGLMDFSGFSDDADPAYYNNSLQVPLVHLGDLGQLIFAYRVQQASAELYRE